jgi:hypothetical protein
VSASGHPSTFALERGGPGVDAHVAGCDACRARVEAAGATDRAFATDVLPRTLGRVRARLVETPRSGWRRAQLVRAGFVAVAAAALVVIATRPPREAAPAYDGLKGETAAPFAVFVKRGADVWTLGRGQKLRAGDALRFVARVSRPRYLELRGRDGGGHERTLFPEGARAALVQPGEALPGGFVVDAAPGPERLVARIADRPFTVGDAAETDVEIVRVELPKEP